MKMKIIYIGYQPLSEKTRDDFYIIKAIEQDYDVEYWDLSNIYFPKVQLPKLRDEYIVYINSLLDLENRITNQSIRQSLFILLVTFESRVLKLFLLLTKHNCQTAFFARGALPSESSNSKSIISKLRKALNPSLLLAFCKNKYSAFLKRKGSVKPYDLVFSAGELGIQTIGYGCQIEKTSSKIISINSFDFDKFVLTVNCDNLIEKKYCVFLDEYLPYHPDFELFGIETIESDEYYNTLNNFLGVIENRFHIEVIIAAHPKAEKYKSKNPFAGRKIFFNKTAELTKFAEFTIAHCSTSLSFAVLNCKPIIFLYSNPLKSIMPNYYNLISMFSKTLGCTLINIDNFSLNEIKTNTIDQLKYTDYKYKYLTSKESEGLTTSEIFFDAISKL